MSGDYRVRRRERRHCMRRRLEGTCRPPRRRRIAAPTLRPSLSLDYLTKKRIEERQKEQLRIYVGPDLRAYRVIARHRRRFEMFATCNIHFALRG